MKPGARLLESLILWSEYDYEKPSDDYLHSALKSKRYIGGSDRRAIRDLFYTFLRKHILLAEKLNVVSKKLSLKASTSFEHFRWMLLIYLKENDPKSLHYFSGETYHLEKITEVEQKIINICPIKAHDPATSHNLTPFWYEKLKHQFGDKLKNHVEALDKEALLDVRINTLKLSQNEALHLLKAHGVESTLLPYSPFGLRIQNKEAFPNDLIQKGFFEPQDEGSQLITLLCDVKEGMRVVDFCAGAGGKTLGLSMQMRNKGHIIASDISEHRLRRSKERLRRLDLHNVMVKALDATWIKRHKEEFDRVLVDAPCSGSGTWRRNPDLKMRTGENDVLELIQKQRDILEQAARLVKVGGRLIYSTCSLLRDENDAQIEWFLENNNDFKVVNLSKVWSEALDYVVSSHGYQKGMGDNVSNIKEQPSFNESFTLTPLDHGTDGFFVGCVERVK